MTEYWKPLLLVLLMTDDIIGIIEKAIIIIIDIDDYYCDIISDIIVCVCVCVLNDYWNYW